MKKNYILTLAALLSLGLFGFSVLPEKPLVLNSINIVDAFLRDYQITASGRTTLSGDYDNGFVFDTPAQTLSYNSSNGNLSVSGGNTVTIPPAATRSISNNVSRSLNSNYTISSTRDALVVYSITVSCTNPLLSGSSTANAFLEYSTDGGSNWITVSDITNGSSVALTVTLQITQPSKFSLVGVIPANALTRIRSTTTGTASVSFGRAQETLL